MKRILAVFLCLMLFAAGTALADESTLVVSGRSAVYLEADCAGAVLGVSLSGADLTTLQQQANDTMAAICAALVEAGLDEKNIATNYIYISPSYSGGYGVAWSGASAGSYGDESGVQGYTIENSLSIQTDEIDKLGAYIDAAFAAGANSFNSINFSASDDTAARKLALEQAVEDARAKAEIIAAASGKALEGVVEIREGGVSSYAKSAYDGFNGYAMETTAASGTSVRASQVVVTAEVQITYEIR